MSRSAMREPEVGSHLGSSNQFDPWRLLAEPECGAMSLLERVDLQVTSVGEVLYPILWVTRTGQGCSVRSFSVSRESELKIELSQQKK